MEKEMKTEDMGLADNRKNSFVDEYEDMKRRYIKIRYKNAGSKQSTTAILNKFENAVKLKGIKSLSSMESYLDEWYTSILPLFVPRKQTRQSYKSAVKNFIKFWRGQRRQTMFQIEATKTPNFQNLNRRVNALEQQMKELNRRTANLKEE